MRLQHHGHSPARLTTSIYDCTGRPEGVRIVIEPVQRGTLGRENSPTTSVTRNPIRNKKNSSFAIPTDAEAIPPKPNNAARIATMRKPRAQRSIRPLNSSAAAHKKDEGAVRAGPGAPRFAPSSSRRTESSGDKAGVPATHAQCPMYCLSDNSFPSRRKCRIRDTGDRSHTPSFRGWPPRPIRRLRKSVSD